MKLKIQGLVFMAVLFPCMTTAQSARDSVENTIKQMFEAMSGIDTVKLSNCFAPTAILQTIAIGKDGRETVRTVGLSQFITSISKLGQGDADERIQITSIQIDASLASVWTPYKFYYKGNFSHCGANSFQLIRTEEGWKIQYLIDTRRKQGCD